MGFEAIAVIQEVMPHTVF